jgi:hypothetical protein
MRSLEMVGRARDGAGLGATGLDPDAGPAKAEAKAETGAAARTAVAARSMLKATHNQPS